MKMNLSNFSQIANIPRKHLTLVVIIIGLLIVEAGVRLPGFWTLDQSSSTGLISPTVDAALEHAPNPDVIFLGSSRFRNDISPTVVADNLDLPRNRVTNVSFAGGTVFDYTKIYRDNRDIFGDAKVLVVNVGARDFNWGRPSTLGNRFRQKATLIQRIQSPGLESRSDVVAGWFWKTWDARTMLRGYGKKALKGDLARDGFPDRRSEIDELNRIDPLKDDSVVRFNMKPANFAHRIEFHDFQLSTVNLMELVELVELAKQDGVEVILLETPLSPPTIEVIDENYRIEDVLWRQKVLLATGLTVKSVPTMSSLCANWEDCYIDYGHMTINGARAYSEVLGKWLKIESVALSSSKSPIAQVR